MSNIRAIIREELIRKRAITFERFMELALYCPDFGYYERPDATIGRKGDFFTSVSVGSLFGELLAAQFAEWRDQNGQSSAQNTNWQILEAGAHDGRLAGDILGRLRASRADLFKTLEYWMLEPSANRRAAQEKTLRDFAGKTRWFASWDALPETGVRGIIFCNELLDAFPVRRLQWNASRREWLESGVALNGGDFVWTTLPCDDELKAKIRQWRLPPELLRVLPDGFTTEFGQAALDWWRRAARCLKDGKLFAFDYGLEQEEFFQPHRMGGTLRAYHRHHLSANLLERPGRQDITAQVNFSAIREAGEAERLRTGCFVSQAQFLTRILEAMCRKNPASVAWMSKRAQAFQTLVHPDHFGRAFRVLVQEK